MMEEKELLKKEYEEMIKYEALEQRKRQNELN
jgi:hypothetical protein